MPMGEMRGKRNNIQVDFCGYLNVKNIISLTKELLKNVCPPLKSLAFHFEEVKRGNTPAMIMMVITAKNLKEQDITCRVVGLTPDNLRVAISCAFGMIAKSGQNQK
jgi:hypothetical protein